MQSEPCDVPVWIPPSEEFSTRALAASACGLAAQLGLADGARTFDELADDEQRAWETIVRRVQLGTWCVDCLRVFGIPYDELLVSYRGPDGSFWRIVLHDLAEVHKWRRTVNSPTDVQFSTSSGYVIGLYASTVLDDQPVCQTHFNGRMGQRQ